MAELYVTLHTVAVAANTFSNKVTTLTIEFTISTGHPVSKGHPVSVPGIYEWTSPPRHANYQFNFHAFFYAACLMAIRVTVHPR